MFEQIKARYASGYITEAQLDRYVALGAITAQQAAELRGEDPPTPPGPVDAIPKADLDAAYRKGVDSYGQ